VQYGVTGGGNDGAVFTPTAAWTSRSDGRCVIPLTGEVIDTKMRMPLENRGSHREKLVVKGVVANAEFTEAQRARDLII